MTMNKIKARVCKVNETEIEKELSTIDEKHSEASKYYEATRVLQRREKKKQPKIINEEGKIASTVVERCKIITDFFTKLLHKEGIPVSDVCRAVEMEPPYTEEEVSKLAKKLKNNKSADPQTMIAELIKNGPKELHKKIAEVLQLTSKGHPFPEVIRKGKLIPLPKPPKKDEKVYVRPIILLSFLRKILSMSMIERCWTRLKIPKDQAAYQPGRSTTEQVFCLKMLAEKAITTNNYTIFILMLDMSKAFDSIDRKKLMGYLREILTESERYMMHLLINDVVLNVFVGGESGKNVFTNIGSCQGDCLSAFFFILYLAKAIKPLPTMIEREDYNRPLWSELDWLINRDTHNVEIDPKYSDDINFVRSWYPKINQLKRAIPNMLIEDGLHVNNSKTEEYTIEIDGDERRKKCKVLGSLLDTTHDIIWRHGLASSAYKKLERNFKSRSLTKNTKIRIFNAYIRRIHLDVPTPHWSDTSLVRHLVGPTPRWSDTSLVRHLDGPTPRWSDTSLVRQLVGPTPRWSDTSMVRHLSKHCTIGSRDIKRDHAPHGLQLKLKTRYDCNFLISSIESQLGSRDTAPVLPRNITGVSRENRSHTPRICILVKSRCSFIHFNSVSDVIN